MMDQFLDYQRRVVASQIRWEQERDHKYLATKEPLFFHVPLKFFIIEQIAMYESNHNTACQIKLKYKVRSQAKDNSGLQY